MPEALKKEASESRPNDPKKIEYGPARPAVVRSEGSTPSEKYLAKIADKSFLNLWSYSNTFIDKRSNDKGTGKELCDLLVVCGDHVLIFSDKTVGWPGSDDTVLAWKRWYKRAIQKSVDQVRGAERWITKFPDRIFLDPQCTQRLPISLPPPERRKIHGIVVALGAGEACKNHFSTNRGSLFIQPEIKGNAHWEGDRVQPFVVGDVDPQGGFIHVLDDATLDIALGELDTISDFTRYLAKKERLIKAGQLLSAAGEEELVAYYMTHMNSAEQHDFTRPDGTDLGEAVVSFDAGFYDNLKKNPQYLAKKAADKVSYVWDELINQFTENMLAGTSIVPDGMPTELSEMEKGIRHMALVPRYKRRLFGEAIMDGLEKSDATDRFVRSLLPGPSDPDRETAFFFMTLAIPLKELPGGYEQYRLVRRNFLEVYAYALAEKFRELKRIVGIATEAKSNISQGGSSEDLIVLEPAEWSPEFLAQLEESKKKLGIMQKELVPFNPRQEPEFPNVSVPKLIRPQPSLNRKQRRAAAAKARSKRRH
jgi:hypothetical protein